MKTLFQLMRDHEGRTGTNANMRMLGWRPVGGVIAATGARRQFVKGNTARVSRDTKGKWKVSINRTTSGRYPTWRQVSPLFDGPVVAAMWYEIYSSGGNTHASYSAQSG